MITTATAQGSRPYQEDRFFVSEQPDGTLLGVLDGHGGDEVSSLLSDMFPVFWTAIDGSRYEQAMLEVFRMANALTQSYYSGSTASLVFIPKGENIAHIAVLGDSPVFAQRANGELFVGPDHNARSNPEERSAAIARGGFYSGGYMWGYGDYSHGLQMTRALGDAACAMFLNRVPEVFTIHLGDWLLLGSDGLFDPSHLSGNAYDDVLACIRNGNSAEDLVRQAVALPTRDNVTAILWRKK